jgi:hypothetical protein
MQELAARRSDSSLMRPGLLKRLRRAAIFATGDGSTGLPVLSLLRVLAGRAASFSMGDPAACQAQNSYDREDLARHISACMHLAVLLGENECD